MSGERIPMPEGLPNSRPKRRGRIRRWLKRVAAALVVLLAALVGLSALSNRLLPSHSSTVERLSDLDKARIAEVQHLRQVLGNRLWPGWGDDPIPVIQYNEQYAFLIGYSEPPAGWRKVPQDIHRGGPWEPVPDDSFEGQTYYRQQLPGPDAKPEAFTVRVGDRWVASMTTKEWTEIALGHEIRDHLPGALRAVVPYRLLGRILTTDWHICGVLHEVFHAWQGMRAPERLARAEGSMSVADRYPWEEAAFRAEWQKEANLLADALSAPSQAQTIELVRRFLAQRQDRRTHHGMDAALIEFEQLREWEEGLAKYMELAAWRLAAESADYRPVPKLRDDPDFHQYQDFPQRWAEEIRQLRRAAHTRDNRFYSTGMAQAFLLDRLWPDWKAEAPAEGLFLEDLLRKRLPSTD